MKREKLAKIIDPFAFEHGPQLDRDIALAAFMEISKPKTYVMDVCWCGETVRRKEAPQP